MYTHLSLIVQSFNLLDDRVAYRRRIPKTITGARHSTRTQSLPLSFLLRRLREKHFATFIRADASSKWKRIALRVHLKERLLIFRVTQVRCFKGSGLALHVSIWMTIWMSIAVRSIHNVENILVRVCVAFHCI